jgi:hypothetical protein
VIGQVERDDAEAPDQLAVIEQVAILSAVGARRVQAKQRPSGARLLDENAVRGASMSTEK